MNPLAYALATAIREIAERKAAEKAERRAKLAIGERAAITIRRKPP